MVVIFFHHLSSSSIHIKLHLAVFQRVELRQGLLIIVFSQQYVATSLSLTSLMQNQQEGVCVFFVCLSFLLRFACLPVSARHVFHLFLNRSGGPSAEKSGQVTQMHCHDSVISSQLIKHHCTSFFSSLHQVQHYYCVHQPQYISLLLLFTSKATFVSVFNKTTAVSHKRQEPVHCVILCF